MKWDGYACPIATARDDQVRNNTSQVRMRIRIGSLRRRRKPYKRMGDLPSDSLLFFKKKDPFAFRLRTRREEDDPAR